MTAPLPALLATAVATFVATDLDDLFLLTAWFSDRSYRTRHIAVGQFLGIAALIAISVLLGLIGLFVPSPITGILGVVPAGIGIWRLTRDRTADHDHAGSAAKSVFAVAGVTIGLIQLAWRFLRFQKDSALAQWYRGRTEDTAGKRKRTMIVALARKLLIALWRLVTIGEIPVGVAATGCRLSDLIEQERNNTQFRHLSRIGAEIADHDPRWW
jgi:hypothetical protein